MSFSLVWTTFFSWFVIGFLCLFNILVIITTSALLKPVIWWIKCYFWKCSLYPVFRLVHISAISVRLSPIVHWSLVDCRMCISGVRSLIIKLRIYYKFYVFTLLHSTPTSCNEPPHLICLHSHGRYCHSPPWFAIL